MSAHDFIPRADSQFDIWQGNLVSLVEPNVANWGIAAAALTTLKTLQANWERCFEKASNKQNRSAADVRAKRDSRVLFERELRHFVAQWLNHNSLIADSDRSRMGITVKLATRTPAAVPDSCPVGVVDFSVRQQHTVHYVDSFTNGKAKPAGVQGCEVWMKFGGDAPAHESDFIYRCIQTKSPYTVSFTVADIGKMVYYRLRWVNKRGKTGPWSSIINAVVGG